MNGGAVGRQSSTKASAKCSLATCERKSSELKFCEQSGQIWIDFGLFFGMDVADKEEFERFGNAVVAAVVVVVVVGVTVDFLSFLRPFSSFFITMAS